MDSILSPHSFFSQIQFPLLHSSPRRQLHPLRCTPTRTQNHLSSGGIASLSPLSFASNSLHSPQRRRPYVIAAAVPSDDEGAVSVISFEDVNEKDWSLLDSDEFNSTEKLDRIISAGSMEGPSRVLVSIGSPAFVDRLVETSQCSFLLIVHDSLFVLSDIKFNHEDVKCWQGELLRIPQKWVPFDVIFLYFLPALPFNLDRVLGSLANCSSPGARVVISHPQGREMLEQQRINYRDVVVSDLPDKMTLQKVAANHSFEVVEFVDEPGFFLAVLQFSKA